MSEYTKQAEDFLKATGTEFRVVEFKGRVNQFNSMMDKWEVELKRNGEVWAFPFYMGVGHNGAEPTAYDVLACLTKYDVGSFEEFCAEFGYDVYDEETGRLNKKSQKTYIAVIHEYRHVLRMFVDCLDELCEIQ